MRSCSCSTARTFSSQCACHAAFSLLARAGSWKTVNSSPQPSHRRVPISRISGARSRVCPFLIATDSMLVHNSIRLFDHSRSSGGAGSSDHFEVELNIDHDHSCCETKGWEKKAHPRALEGINYCCGKCVRCLLCGDCNKGLGSLEKAGAAPERVAEYLKNAAQFRINPQNDSFRWPLGSVGQLMPCKNDS